MSGRVLDIAARSLHRTGLAVVPMLSPEELKYFHNQIRAEMKTFQEYKRPATMTAKDRWVAGGFGAMGNPSSFHNNAVRELRARAMHTAVPVFARLEKMQDGDRNLEMLFDRLMYRAAGDSPSSESWHRDISLNVLHNVKKVGDDGKVTTNDKKVKFWHVDPASETDTVFGGWINLDPIGSEPQKFNYVPSTHRDRYIIKKPRKAKSLHCGEEESGMTMIGKAEQKKYDTMRHEAIVPPGSWIVFEQQTVHEVRPGKRTVPMMRLFTGYRLTPSDEPMFDQTDAIAKQGVPRIPSGQQPVMYPRLNWVNGIKNLAKWSQQTFADPVLHEHERTETVKAAKGKQTQGDEKESKGKGKAKKPEKVTKRWLVVDRCMRSLQEYKFDLYPDYRDAEKEILTPRREWLLPVQRAGAPTNWDALVELSMDTAWRPTAADGDETETDSDSQSDGSQSDRSDSDSDGGSSSSDASDSGSGDESEDAGPPVPDSKRDSKSDDDDDVVELSPAQVAALRRNRPPSTQPRRSSSSSSSSSSLLASSSSFAPRVRPVTMETLGVPLPKRGGCLPRRLHFGPGFWRPHGATARQLPSPLTK